MCFSAEADLIAGLVVTGVGIETLRHVGHHKEATLAVLPMVFGVHQLVEVPVWLGAEGRVSEGVAHSAAWLYLLIAFGVIPWLVPSAVRALEFEPSRRRSMRAVVWLGVLVAFALTVPIVAGPVAATTSEAHVAYSAELFWGGPFSVLYVAATCGALLASSDRVVRVYGLINLVAVGTLAILLTSGVISLWCVWAAVTSIAIAIHLRRQHRPHEALAVAVA